MRLHFFVINYFEVKLVTKMVFQCGIGQDTVLLLGWLGRKGRESLFNMLSSSELAQDIITSAMQHIQL